MKTSRFFVSVIIPVHNGAKFLPEAIQSVQTQNYQPLEIIIVDDGSIDKTATVVDRYRPQVKNLVYHYQARQGVSAARNQGIRLAQGNAIVFLDADDLLAPNSLQRGLNYLRQDASVDIVQGYVQELKLSILETSLEKEQLQFELLNRPHFNFNLGSAIYRQSVFEQVGFFDESLSLSEDVDWFMRAWESQVNILVIQQVSLFYRKHFQNTTYGTTIQTNGFLNALKKSLDRRREQSNARAKPFQPPVIDPSSK
jgi:glycosyltransferase involved in cell wall biosynthesis